MGLSSQAHRSSGAIGGYGQDLSSPEVLARHARSPLPLARFVITPGRRARRGATSPPMTHYPENKAAGAPERHRGYYAASTEVAGIGVHLLDLLALVDWDLTALQDLARWVDWGFVRSASGMVSIAAALGQG